MRPRIAPNRIAYVLKLLRGGMSQRQASIASGISVGRVNQIANGQSIQFSEDAQVDFQTVKPYTCPTCNRLVTTAPCVKCTSKRGA